jgi:hypothetical protein
MTHRPTIRPATSGQPGACPGKPALARPSGTRTRRTAAGLRRRALLAGLGLAVVAAVLPATAAHASPQPPDPGARLTNPGGNPQPPQPPEPPDVPDWGPGDLANPTENPEPPLPPDPPEPPGKGPGDLVNPTADPDPPTPPKDPHPSGDVSFPTPERVDAGFGGAAAGTSRAAAGLALIAAALLLALLVVVVARRHHAESGPAR